MSDYGDIRLSRFRGSNRDIAAQLIDAAGRADQLVASVTSEQLRVRPDPTRWSMAECIDHLTITNRSYVPLFRAALASGTKPRSRDEFHHGIIGRLFIRVLEPPVRQRLKAPRRFLPESAMPDDVVTPFHDVQRELLSILADADDVDLERIKVQSPASRLIRYNMAAAFAILAAHERRHLWQAEQVRALL